MDLKEKIAYVIGTIVLIYGAYAGRDLTKLNEIIEGSAMVALIVCVFIVFVYINRRGVGDWHQKYDD